MKLTVKPTYTYAHMENAIAIAGVVTTDKHFDPAIVSEMYQGCAGLYTLIAEVAVMLEKVIDAEDDDGTGWDGYDWYLTCDALAAWIAQELPTSVSEEDVKQRLVAIG